MIIIPRGYKRNGIDWKIGCLKAFNAIIVNNRKLDKPIIPKLDKISRKMLCGYEPFSRHQQAPAPIIGESENINNDLLSK